MNTDNRRTVEVLADRAVPLLIQLAKAGRTIEYGQLAALITRKGEPLVPNQLVGKVCETILKDVAEMSVHETRPEMAYLTAFVVLRNTGEVSTGWAEAMTRYNLLGPLEAFTYERLPQEARRLSHEWISEDLAA